MANLNTIKNWFKTGLKPTQQQFWDTWDSYWHKDEPIPVAKIDGIDGLLNQKANKAVLDNHLADAGAHATEFGAKEDKANKGKALGYVPLNDSGKIMASYLSIVNDLFTGGSAALLSAEQGVLLRQQLDKIDLLLKSDDVNLDNVQELVAAIKSIQLSLSTILVNDLTTGGVTKALTAEQGKLLKGLITTGLATTSTAVDNRLRFDLDNQGLTEAQKTNAKKNIGLETVVKSTEVSTIWSGTLVQYNAIANKLATTLYFVS